MKTVLVLLVVLLVVLWAGMAWTAGAETTWVYPLGNGKTVDMSTPCPDIGATALTLDDKLIQCHGSKGWTQIQMICEQQMQAAMEAMDWHVEHLVHPSRDPGFYRYQTNREALIAAYRQWADAKACWRKP